MCVYGVCSRQLAERLDFIAFMNNAFKWFNDAGNRFSNIHEDPLGDFKEEKEIWIDLQRQVTEKYGIGEITLQMFLQEFDLSPKSPPIPSDAVKCFTIHSAKGMEFEHVYLIGMVEEQLPSYASINKGEDSREMQEERRNCFVAITRTQSTLTMTFANQYFGWTKRPSRFLREMGL